MNKSELRRQIRIQRRSLSPQHKRQAAQQLLHSLRQSKHFQHSQHIAIYITNDGEIDTSVLIKDLRQRGKTLYLPVVHPLRKGHLAFVRWQATQPMHKNRFGILEPQLNPAQSIPTAMLQLICMPLVAFDESGNRLGMGGGFYDRSLAFMHQQGNKPALIGLAYELQKVAQLPVEAWDIPLTAIATNQQLYQFN